MTCVITSGLVQMIVLELMGEIVTFVHTKQYCMLKGTQTRQTILLAALDMTYAKGFQATSIDEILKKTHVTKGSFFHHFKNKDDMGVAMVSEIMYPGMYRMMIEPLLAGEDPIQEIYEMMNGLLSNEEAFRAEYGCPAINLIQEMAPLKPAFNAALSRLMKHWLKAINESLQKAKSTGQIDPNTNTEEVAIFILSGYGGVRNLGKVQGRACYHAYLNTLRTYLQKL